MTARKKPVAWAPPPGLRIEIGVTRGDVFFKADATPAEALNVARMLTAMARKITAEAPDLLPLADSVPGGSLYVADDDDYEARQTKPHLGFSS